MGPHCFVIKLMIEDECSLLRQHCWDDDAIPSHFPIGVISYKGETKSIDLIVMMLHHRNYGRREDEPEYINNTPC